MQNKPMPAEGNDSAQQQAESALRGAACSILPFFVHAIVVRGVENANPLIKKGWALQSIHEEFWSTKNGGYDSGCVFLLLPRSRVWRFVTQCVNKVLRKAPVLLGDAARPDVEDDPFLLQIRSVDLRLRDA